MLKVKYLKKKIRIMILNILFRNHKILLQYTSQSLYVNLKYLKTLFSKNNPQLNFIITSKAEIRIFSPIISYLIKKSNFHINIIFLRNYKFDASLLNQIFSHSRVHLTNSTLPLVFSINNANYLNLICLDFLTEKSHKLGADIMTYLGENNSKTICVQHGGSQRDNVIGQSTSSSNYQLVFGRIMYNSLLELGLKKDKIYLTGNPIHDNIIHINKTSVKEKLESESFIVDKKILLIATCLFQEYDDRNNPDVLYRQYIRTIYENIDFNRFKVIVKMHPNDTVSPNIYFESAENFIDLNNLKIILPEDTNFSFYELAKISDILISRSSTVIEEGIMLGMKVIAFDLFEDGPSRHLEHLDNFNNYEKVIFNRDKLLKNVIEEFIDKEINILETDYISAMFTRKLDGKSNEMVKKALLNIIAN